MPKTGDSSRRLKVQRYTVDENGELVNFEETTKVVSTTDAYIKIFEPGWRLPEMVDVSYSFVVEVIGRMTFADAGQVVSLSPADKDMLARKMEKSVRQVERMLKSMVDAGILRKMRRGHYQVNPFMFGRGRQCDIDALRSRYMVEAIGKKGERDGR